MGTAAAKLPATSHRVGWHPHEPACGHTPASRACKGGTCACRVDIVLDPLMTVREAHDIGEAGQCCCFCLQRDFANQRVKDAHCDTRAWPLGGVDAGAKCPCSALPPCPAGESLQVKLELLPEVSRACESVKQLHLGVGAVVRHAAVLLDRGQLHRRLHRRLQHFRPTATAHAPSSSSADVHIDYEFTHAPEHS